MINIVKINKEHTRQYPSALAGVHSGGMREVLRHDEANKRVDYKVPHLFRRAGKYIRSLL